MTCLNIAYCYIIYNINENNVVWSNLFIWEMYLYVSLLSGGLPKYCSNTYCIKTIYCLEWENLFEIKSHHCSVVFQLHFFSMQWETTLLFRTKINKRCNVSSSSSSSSVYFSPLNRSTSSSGVNPYLYYN